MKPKKTNIWIPFTIILGILIAAILMLTLIVAVNGHRTSQPPASHMQLETESEAEQNTPGTAEPELPDFSTSPEARINTNSMQKEETLCFV